MPNKILANEWLKSGKKHLEVAEILFDNGHYNDIVGLELQQSLERNLKAILAFNDKTIVRTHNISMLLKEVRVYIEFDEEIHKKSDLATDYYQDKRYPGGGINYLPSNEEIEIVIETTKLIYNKVFEYINAKSSI